MREQFVTGWSNAKVNLNLETYTKIFTVSSIGTFMWHWFDFALDINYVTSMNLYSVAI
jgi:hypothetical protein